MHLLKHVRMYIRACLLAANCMYTECTCGKQLCDWCMPVVQQLHYSSELPKSQDWIGHDFHPNFVFPHCNCTWSQPSRNNEMVQLELDESGTTVTYLSYPKWRVPYGRPGLNWKVATPFKLISKEPSNDLGL